MPSAAVDQSEQEGSSSRQAPLERYFSILEKVAAHPGLTAAEAANLCSLPFPTAYRLIQGLRQAGLLTGGRREGYKLGNRMLRLLQTGADDSWIRITAQKKLDEVAGRIGETCYLAKLVDKRIVSVAWAAPPSGLRGYVMPGLSQPLHAAACAKAILAHHPAEFVRSILPDPLPKICVNTKTRREEVLAEMKAIKRRGFATCVDENEAGVTAIACPIQIAGVGVIYSIGVMALSDRLHDLRLKEVANILECAASDLSLSVGPSKVD
ncbi:MAG: IclR family transcriptional regulator C-terminal domain-containing protein [Roseiarcus sp.]|jgi:DNA-binding IclR family transcriptional regulator